MTPQLLDLQYRFLIALFIIAVPVHTANFLIIYKQSTPYATIFLGLIIVALGLVPLFRHLRAEHRIRSLIQNVITLGNLFLVIGSSHNLFNYVFGL